MSVKWTPESRVCYARIQDHTHMRKEGEKVSERDRKREVVLIKNHYFILGSYRNILMCIRYRIKESYSSRLIQLQWLSFQFNLFKYWLFLFDFTSYSVRVISVIGYRLKGKYCYGYLENINTQGGYSI